jgi:hypothetical protein
MILILSRQDDEHVPFVTRKLDERQTDYVWFNPARFPADAEITIEFEPASGASRRLLKYDGRVLDLDTVSAVWYRRPQAPAAAQTVTDTQLRDWISRESQHVVSGLWDILDCTWLPGTPRDVLRAENKIYQLVTAARLGFAIPRTAIGNDPAAMTDIYRKSGGNMVTKAAVKEASCGGERYLIGYAHVVQQRELVNRESIRLAPAIMQEYVAKDVELRINVIGTRVLAAEIHSQATASTKFDWRRYDLDRTPHLPHALPSDIESRCIELVRTLRLNFGAIDMIRTPEGKYVFLEINPNGQWGWIELLTGLPIADAIADLLLHTEHAMSHA